MNNRKEIDKLACILINENKLLVARSKGKDLFYIPGGKRESGESDEQSLIREIKEELSVDINSDSLKLAGVFKAQADGKLDGTIVKMTCYFADYTGELKADNEIDELMWVGFDDRYKCSQVTQSVIEWLYKNDFLKTFKENKLSSIPAQPKYEWILFDADKTLFQFDDFKGLQNMFKQYGVEFSQADYSNYQAINRPLWDQYQNGQITAYDVQVKRFINLAKRVNRTAEELNASFLNSMADICMPLDGVVELLNSIQGKVRKGIVTNGFTALQEVRLQRTGLAHHFEVLVISEKVGVAKPDRLIFEHALVRMGNPDKSKVLMVGDSLQSDIQGAINAGIDTCWYNEKSQIGIDNIVPRYHVQSHAELGELIRGKKLLNGHKFPLDLSGLGRAQEMKLTVFAKKSDEAPQPEHGSKLTS